MIVHRDKERTRNPVFKRIQYEYNTIASRMPSTVPLFLLPFSSFFF